MTVVCRSFERFLAHSYPRENECVQGLAQLEDGAWKKWGIDQQSKAKHPDSGVGGESFAVFIPKKGVLSLQVKYLACFTSSTPDEQTNQVGSFNTTTLYPTYDRWTTHS